MEKVDFLSLCSGIHRIMQIIHSEEETKCNLYLLVLFFLLFQKYRPTHAKEMHSFEQKKINSRFVANVHSFSLIEYL